MNPKTQKGQRFGGDWTTQKLGVLSSYLSAYTTALKNQPFATAYIDAFAGTGHMDPAAERGPEDYLSLFPDLAASEPQALLDGSARMALKVHPPFQNFIFIEKSPARCAHLLQLRAEFIEHADRIAILQGDGNTEIPAYCQRMDRRKDRAVLFLDPFGMQVEWATLEAVAATKAIDMWLLFPLGIGVNRLLRRDAQIPDSWRRRLNLLLGTEDWFRDFYAIEHEPDLFGQEERVVKASMDVIGRYFNDRLKSIFAGVAEKPGVLRNSANNPLYLLCFAVSNPSGKRLALRIAEHILKEVR